MLAKMAIMAITTSNSINVKPVYFFVIISFAEAENLCAVAHLGALPTNPSLSCKWKLLIFEDINLSVLTEDIIFLKFGSRLNFALFIFFSKISSHFCLNLLLSY